MYVFVCGWVPCVFRFSTEARRRCWAPWSWSYRPLWATGWGYWELNWAVQEEQVLLPLCCVSSSHIVIFWWRTIIIVCMFGMYGCLLATVCGRSEDDNSWGVGSFLLFSHGSRDRSRCWIFVARAFIRCTFFFISLEFSLLSYWCWGWTTKHLLCCWADWIVSRTPGFVLGSVITKCFGEGFLFLKV